MKKRPQFVVFIAKDGGWRWHLRAGNGEVIAQGEGFTSKRDAGRSVTAVKRAVVSIVGEKS